MKLEAKVVERRKNYCIWINFLSMCICDTVLARGSILTFPELGDDFIRRKTVCINIVICSRYFLKVLPSLGIEVVT